jgi:RNA polymerase sigma-70 factor (ECF subfamily)
VEKSEWLAEQFEANRTHLRAVAYRMLGSLSEADDAVQESWLHISRSDTSNVVNLGGWLTTVVARQCLDMLRSRKSRYEEALGSHIAEPMANHEVGTDPEHETQLADSVGLALLVVLETLTPDERLAFVLHDLFAVPFAEIAPIVGRTPLAARKLASRARRRVQGATTASEAELALQREIVDAFLAASRSGDFEALLALLDPDVVFRPDQTAIAAGAFSGLHGAEAVAKGFKGRAQGIQPVLVNGTAGAMALLNGQPRGVFRFTINKGKITEIQLIADPAQINQLDLLY